MSAVINTRNGLVAVPAQGRTTSAPKPVALSVSTISEFVVLRAPLAWMLAILTAIGVGIGAAELARMVGERERMAQVQTAAERRAVEIMSQTLGGTMMGAMSILGLTDTDVKSEAVNALEPNSPRLAALLESVGIAFDADGVFFVGTDGIVKSSWDSSGKRSTGLNVKFRPYALMAMQGAENVYAAVSLATGKRALYFAAPVYAGKTKATAATGAAVIRTNLARVDNLLHGEEEIALLLSPQGVVFASSRADWIGHLAGAATPERLKAIRDLKQFGTMFESNDPPLLPMAVESGITLVEGKRYAVARANVQWNDPYGDWTLVLMEDLTRTLPLANRAGIGLATALGVMLLGILVLRMLHAHHAETVATRELQAHAERQELMTRRKSRLAAALMRLQQATTLADLAQAFLDEASRMVGVLQAALYVTDAEASRHMVLAAGYACAADIPAALTVGDGLLGQCALEGKPIFIEAPTQAYWRISSGLGEAMPHMVVLLPVRHNDVVLGVVEFAALRRLDADDLAILDELLPLLALNLEIQWRNRRAEEMKATTLAAERELERMGEMERFNRLAQGREQRIVELKSEVNALAGLAGKTAPYTAIQIETVGDHEIETDKAIAAGGDARELQLADLVDLGELQTLFSNFCEAVGVAAAIIDLEGKVLASARWQRACTDFHRVNAASCARCIESDTELALKLQDGADFTLYKCKNGMTDCASPIVVEGRQLANVFIGQFHVGPPDLGFFTAQARQFGYPEVEYLQAVNAAPVIDERRLPLILGFLSGFARMITTMSLARRRADDAQQRLQHERIAAMSLAEDAEQARRALENRNTELKP